MPTLSRHTAYLAFPDTNETIEPISVDVTVAENWSPSIRATVTIKTGSEPYALDPTIPTIMGLRLQQDFGELVYINKITADYSGIISAITAAFTPVIVSAITGKYSKPWNIFETGLPLSTVTTSYTPVTPLKLTNANLATVYRMSDFLHSEGTFNPQESTVFDARVLMLRSLIRNYISGETTLELASLEAILQDSIGWNYTSPISSTSLRTIIQWVLEETGAGSPFNPLQPGTADATYSPAYTLQWLPNQTAWDVLNSLVTAANLVLYCDEKGLWWLEEAGSTTGTLELKDTDNITSLTERIDRNNQEFFDYAVVEYRNAGVSVYRNYGTYGFSISKDAYFLRDNIKDPGGNEAQSLVMRAETRAQTWQVTAISNYDARPRQTMTLDLTGQPTVTKYIQSVSWSLPADTMNLTFR